VKAPVEIVVRIVPAVERHGGDMSDVEDLIAEWVRIHGYQRADADDEPRMSTACSLMSQERRGEH
jgi:hypothetical protein